jgi:hypothetical protein
MTEPSSSAEYAMAAMQIAPFAARKGVHAGPGRDARSKNAPPTPIRPPINGGETLDFGAPWFYTGRHAPWSADDSPQHTP